MKRSIKNVLMILIIIAVGICSCFTIKSVLQNQTTQDKMPMTQDQGGPGNNNQSEPQELPSGESNSSSNEMKEPPAKPDEDNNKSSDSNNSNDSNNMAQNDKGTPPSMPSGNGNNQAPDQMPDMSEQNEKGNTIETVYYVLFGIEGFVIAIFIMYLVMSKFNKLTLRETLDGTSKIIIFVVLVVIITGALTLMQVAITNSLNSSENNEQGTSQMAPGGNMNMSSSTVTKTGATQIDGTTETLTDSYTTSESDKSVILVENGGNLTLDGAEVTKDGGDSSNTENSEFYGVNAGILVTEGSTATIKNATISTNAKGSNAVFSTGTDSKIYISDSTITTTGSSSSRGLDSTYGGYIEADNVTITTQGGSCATLATDRGEGTVIANDSKLETNGSGSPIIYSTGDISITNTQGVANNSQMVVIEGKNSATVTDSTLTSSAKGNRGDTDQAGIMIYQSMSGDAGEGTGTFTGKNSSLSINEDSEYYKTAPMFFITNTDAVINLNNCTLSYGSNILIKAQGTSEWGNSGSNGGNVTLNAEDQTLEGNIEIDKISTLKMNLTNSSYTGTINADNTASEISLKLDSNSKITLTGDSYVTSLEDSDSSYSNIDFNGYKLYVNGVAIN